MGVNKYKRTSTNTTISIFYEQHSLNKYNYDPPYQRDYNVWDDIQKSFLIDSIFKNFPMPAIFLEQKIQKGKTSYDVIDGKQRLNTIIQFIESMVSLPMDFGTDEYGYTKMNGLKMSEIELLAETDESAKELLNSFWSYVINIEYIEQPNEKIVDSIFDRLNRGGERLNGAELRKAKYYDSVLYQSIFKTACNKALAPLIKRLDKTRLEHVSFITELYLLTYTNEVTNGVEKDIDKQFEKYVDEIDNEKANEVEEKVEIIANVVNSFNLNYDTYSIAGTSHLFAIYYLALVLYNHEENNYDYVSNKLNEFYLDLRNEKKNEFVNIYSASMQSASKYKSSRNKRIRELLGYMGYTWDE